MFLKQVLRQVVEPSHHRRSYKHDDGGHGGDGIGLLDGRVDVNRVSAEYDLAIRAAGHPLGNHAEHANRMSMHQSLGGAGKRTRMMTVPHRPSGDRPR